MRVLFCKISSMKYYKGACNTDEPHYGGKFVEENGYGHEEFNFLPIKMDGGEELKCVGFVEPKSNRGKQNTLHIENIEGCDAMKNEECIDDVLVIWCAKRQKGDVTVVGWYKKASVWRSIQDWIIPFPNGVEENRGYNVQAKSNDCVLLPEPERNRHIWFVPSAHYTKSFGFGQSMVWYPTQPEAKAFVDRLIENINNYAGENWLNEYPEA